MIAAACAACGSPQVAPLQLVQTGDRTAVLETTCPDEDAADPAVQVVETGTEVRFDAVSGTRNGGDCLGSIRVEFEAPIGDRAVVVEGEEWVRIDDDCERAAFGPADAGGRRRPVSCEYVHATGGGDEDDLSPD